MYSRENLKKKTVLKSMQRPFDFIPVQEVDAPISPIK